MLNYSEKINSKLENWTWKIMLFILASIVFFFSPFVANFKLKYWVVQKVLSDFSMTSNRKTQMKFWTTQYNIHL